MNTETNTDLAALEAEEQRLYEEMGVVEKVFSDARTKWNEVYTRLQKRRLLEEAKAELLAEKAQAA